MSSTSRLRKPIVPQILGSKNVPLTATILRELLTGNSIVELDKQKRNTIDEISNIVKKHIPFEKRRQFDIDYKGSGTPSNTIRNYVRDLLQSNKELSDKELNNRIIANKHAYLKNRLQELSSGRTTLKKQIEQSEVQQELDFLETEFQEFLKPSKKQEPLKPKSILDEWNLLTDEEKEKRRKNVDPKKLEEQLKQDILNAESIPEMEFIKEEGRSFIKAPEYTESFESRREKTLERGREMTPHELSQVIALESQRVVLKKEIQANADIDMKKGNLIFKQIRDFLQLPGYNFCGPGTDVLGNLLKSKDPVNELDQACQIHDMQYLKIANIIADEPKKANEWMDQADDQLRKKVEKIRDSGKMFVYDPNPHEVKIEDRISGGVGESAKLYGDIARINTAMNTKWFSDKTRITDASTFIDPKPLSGRELNEKKKRLSLVEQYLDIIDVPEEIRNPDLDESLRVFLSGTSKEEPKKQNELEKFINDIELSDTKTQIEKLSQKFGYTKSQLKEVYKKVNLDFKHNRHKPTYQEFAKEISKELLSIPLLVDIEMKSRKSELRQDLSMLLDSTRYTEIAITRGLSKKYGIPEQDIRNAISESEQRYANMRGKKTESDYINLVLNKLITMKSVNPQIVEIIPEMITSEPNKKVSLGSKSMGEIYQKLQNMDKGISPEEAYQQLQDEFGIPIDDTKKILQELINEPGMIDLDDATYNMEASKRLLGSINKIPPRIKPVEGQKPFTESQTIEEDTKELLKTYGGPETIEQYHGVPIEDLTNVNQFPYKQSEPGKPADQAAHDIKMKEQFTKEDKDRLQKAAADVAPPGGAPISGSRSMRPLLEIGGPEDVVNTKEVIEDNNRWYENFTFVEAPNANIQRVPWRLTSTYPVNNRLLEAQEYNKNNLRYGGYLYNGADPIKPVYPITQSIRNRQQQPMIRNTQLSQRFTPNGPQRIYPGQPIHFSRDINKFAKPIQNNYSNKTSLYHPDEVDGRII